MELEPTLIDATLAARLVAAQFPQWADLAVRPIQPGGWDNRTFRLGGAMSVRLPSAERYAAQVAKEQTWLPRLAPELPLPIPTPLAAGAPAFGYPWTWSVYRWLDGADASRARVHDLTGLARDLAAFLVALHRVDAASGPAAGAHNFFRGGPLAVYDDETRAAICALTGVVNQSVAIEVWEAALAATWHRDPVWVHGDVSADNLLVKEGRLSAVVDFGGCGVGDPACDLAIAWTLFHGPSRAAFRAGLGLDSGTWARGRGWALWKALITLVEHGRGATNVTWAGPSKARRARRTLRAVLADPVTE